MVRTPVIHLAIASCATFWFLPQFDVFCDLLLNRRTATWNLFVMEVRAHYYCSSLVRTLHMTWRVPRHVFQAWAPSRNSTKYRADDLCGNLICEYFCWMLGDPHFFFGRSLPFLILCIILKNKKNLCVGSFSYFSYTIQIGSNWYMDTGVPDLELASFKANSTWFNDIYRKDLSNRPIFAMLNTHILDMILQLKYMPIVI